MWQKSHQTLTQFFRTSSTPHWTSHCISSKHPLCFPLTNPANQHIRVHNWFNYAQWNAGENVKTKNFIFNGLIVPFIFKSLFSKRSSRPCCRLWFCMVLIFLWWLSQSLWPGLKLAHIFFPARWSFPNYAVVLYWHETNLYQKNQYRKLSKPFWNKIGEIPWCYFFIIP